MKALIFSPSAAASKASQWKLEPAVFTLTSRFRASVEYAESPESAKKHVLASTPDIVLWDAESGADWGNVSKHAELWATLGEALVIVCGKKSDAERLSSALGSSVAIVGAADLDNLAKDLAALLDPLIQSGKLKVGLPEHGYCPIETAVLVEMSPLQADIYIRLTDTKFVRLFQAGDPFDHSDLEKYRDQKHVGHLYIKPGDVKVVLEKLTAELQGKLREAELEPKDTQALGRRVISTMRSLVDPLGVTPEIQELTKLQVAMTMKSIKFNYRISGILKQLSQEGGYLAAHSLSLSYLAPMICNKTKLASEHNSQKLCFAALLHDLPLHNQALSQIETLAEFEARKSEFTTEEQKAFQYHTIRAAERCNQFEVIPPDVSTIVMQHHERPDGSGFPRRMKFPQINPLSAIFIIAHELLNYIRVNHVEKGDVEAKTFSMDDFLRAAEPLYHGHFADVIEAIRFE